MNDLIITARHARTPRFICNSQTGEKLIEFGGVQLWKNIPAEIKSSDFYNIFNKKAYKKYPIDLMAALFCKCLTHQPLYG